LITVCSVDNPVLTLTTRFGAIELTGFENALGTFSSIVPILLTYTIENTGDFSMVVESAVVDSDFAPDPVQVLNSELPLEGGERIIVYLEPATIDTASKFSDGITFEFAMDVIGRAQRSTGQCFAASQYSF
jgi:hypothetical protein